MQQNALSKLTPFAKYAWVVLAYNVAVILWGAYVRATGSGAGCGGHWPLCDGQVFPQSPGVEMMIEYSHRVSSGIVIPLVIALVIWAFRAYPRGHLARAGAIFAITFTITEALVGAGLVLFGLVAQNDSMERAVVISIHLTNTFLLLASLTLTAYWASGGQRPQVRGQRAMVTFVVLALVGVLVVGISGAVTALGDTLFPAASLAQGLQDDFSPTTQLLVRLRVLHPLIAISVGLYVILLARVLSAFRPVHSVRAFASATSTLVIIQWAAGFVNIYLLAPIWLQLVHLLLADSVWIALVLLGASSLAQPVPAAETSEPHGVFWDVRRLWEALVGAD